MCSVNVIIPTKNRYDALAEAFRSIAKQTLLPSEIIVVDQTEKPGDQPAKLARLLPPSIRLDYVCDSSIAGSAVARNVAIERARGDILLFLDDDVTIYPDFVERLVNCYRENPSAHGISGVPDNYSPPGRFYYWWAKIFMRGPFHDDRQPIFWSISKLKHPLEVTRMSSGMMSLKQTVLGQLRFDSNLRGVPGGEDVDLCIRVGGPFLIDPRCKLTHHFDPTGRETDWLRRHVRANTYLYQRNWGSHKIAYAWLSIGWIFAGIVGCVARRSLFPLRSVMQGFRDRGIAARGVELG